MIRLTGAALAAGGCAWLGLKKTQELRTRTRALQEMHEGLSLLAQELELDAPPMEVLMERLSKQSRGCARRLFKHCATRLAAEEERSFSLLWQNALKECGELEEQARLCVESLGYTLGQCDVPAQLKGVESVCHRLEECSVQAALQERQKGKVFCALGLSGGAFLVTLLL